MELTKTKYKQTEVGLIPEDWEMKTLGDVGEVKMCKRIFNYQTSERGDIPFYKIGTFGKEADAFISKTLYNEFRRKYSFPKSGAVLISAAGTIGRTIVYNGDDGYFQDSNIVWIDNNNLVISDEYLKHVFPIVKFRTEGGTIQRLYNNILKSGMFPAPPTLTEQKAIATALSDVDDLISNLEKQITKKKAIKQGAMQELLTPPQKGGKRLPGFSGEWKNEIFGEISFIKGRIGWQGLKQDEFTMNSSQPFLITGMNFKDGKIRWEEVYHVPYERYMIAKEIQLQKGDVLMTKDGTIGKLLYVDNIPSPGLATLNSHLLLFRPLRGAYVPKYLYFHLQSPEFKNHIEINKSGTTFFGISQESIEKYEIILPTYEEQEAIALILSDIDEEIEALEEKKTKYQGIKQGMMQELLTGKTRLV